MAKKDMAFGEFEAKMAGTSQATNNKADSMVLLLEILLPWLAILTIIEAIR